MAAFDPWYVALYLAEALTIGVSVLNIARSVQSVLRASAENELRCQLIEFENERHCRDVDVRTGLPVGDETYVYTAQPSPDSSEADTSVEVDTDESE